MASRRDDLRAGGHDLAGLRVAELDDRLDHLPLLLVDDALLLALLDGGQDLLLDLRRRSVRALPAGHADDQAVHPVHDLGERHEEHAEPEQHPGEHAEIGSAACWATACGIATEQKSVIATVTAAAQM